MPKTLQEDLYLVEGIVDDLNDLLTKVADHRAPNETSDRKIVLEAAALFMLYKGYEAAIDENMSPLDVSRLNELIQSFVVVDASFEDTAEMQNTKTSIH